MRDEPRSPQLEDLLEAHRDVMLDSLWIHLPGQITSYDSSTQTVSVQPMIQSGAIAEDGVAREIKTLPEIHDRPISFPGSGKNRQTFPIKPGDLCTVMWCSSDISSWIVTGAVGDPGSDRRCDYADAIVLPGLSHSSPPTDAPTDAIVVHADDGVEIRLGDSSTSSITDAYAVVVQSALDDFMTALAAAIAANVSPATVPLLSLKAQLQALHTGQGWKANTTVVKAK